MPNSLLTGITGLIAHQRKLDVVANNLANINTVAYKAQRVVFSDLLYETVQPATNGGSSSLGGTNPTQIGSGVQTAQISKKMTQGTLQATGQPFDFAIQGEGFYVLAAGQEPAYSRAGAFSIDNAGFLVDPATGYFVQRHGTVGEGDGLNPAFQDPNSGNIKVPIGATLPGAATANIALRGNLLANEAGPKAEVLTSVTPYLAAGAAATMATLLNDLDSNTVDYLAGDEILISGSNADGSTFQLNVSVAATTTLGDIVNAINSAATDAVASLDGNGNLVFTANDTGDALLTVSIEDTPTNTGSTEFVDHNMAITVDGKAGGSFRSSTEVYDLRGQSHAVTYEFTKQANNEWEISFSIDNEAGQIVDGAVQKLIFNENGTFASAGSTGAGDADIEFKFNGITQPQKIKIDASTLSQFATAYELNGRPDGLASGKIIGMRVTADGVIQGLSSNGEKIPVAQIAIATFENSGGLSMEGENYFSETLNSGTASLGAPGEGGRGTLAGGQLESSNVDVALEFTQLIVAQRGFSANARTITVSNEMLEELTNIVR